MKKSKLAGVAHAIVTLGRISGEQYEQARILLYRTADTHDKIGEVTFQCHRLDFDRYGGLRKPDPTTDKPDHRLDFGPWPYSAHYGAKWDLSSNAYGTRLGAEPWQSGVGIRETLATIAKIQDRIARVVDERNLNRIAGRSRCELAVWIDALEALNVPFELNRYAVRNGDPIYSIHDLDERLRYPATKFFEAIEKNGADNDGHRITVREETA